MLIKTMGNKIKAIHRRSYRIPSKKEGMRFPKDRLLGLNAK